MTQSGTTAKLPATLPVAADFGYPFINFNRLTLDGAINASVESIVVNETINADTPQDGYITIDDEIVHHVSWASKTFTCTGGRAALGTTAASHSDDARCGHFITNLAFNQIMTELLIAARMAVVPAREDKGGSVTVDYSDVTKGYNRYYRITSNIALTLSNPPTRGTFLFELEEDGTGGYTITWSTTIKWSGGTTPTWGTAAGKKNYVTLIYDGADWAGFASVNH